MQDLMTGDFLHDCCLPSFVTAVFSLKYTLPCILKRSMRTSGRCGIFRLYSDYMLILFPQSMKQKLLRGRQIFAAIQQAAPAEIIGQIPGCDAVKSMHPVFQAR